MKIYHENGEIFRLDVIVEMNGGIPVKVFIKNEFRNVYKIKDKYWFKYQNRRCYFEHPIPGIMARAYLKIHSTQCYKCRRLQSGINCLCPDGSIRYFKGNTRRKCKFFEEKA